MSSTVTINGITYKSTNGSICVSGDKIIIDGKVVTPGLEIESKIININIEGNVEMIDIDYCQKISVNGNVKTVRTTNGNVECKDVTGNIQTTNGDVECGTVGGDIQTMSGDVKCGPISGSVKTMSGDIKNSKNERI
jgi:hypothetical protein